MKRHLARLLSLGFSLALCGSHAYGSGSCAGASSPDSTTTVELHRWLDGEFARHLGFSPLARTRGGGPFRDGPVTALGRDIEAEPGALLRADRIDPQQADVS
jgi:hypothetical protein